MHGDNLRHRAVHILIFNKKGEILLQKRSRWKDRHPLLWDSSAAGHVSAGEEYDSAARRELQEELGIDMPLQQVAKLPASDRTDQEFIWVYRGQHDGDFKPEPSEIETVQFFPPDLIDGWIAARPEDFATAFLECWKVYPRRPFKKPNDWRLNQSPLLRAAANSTPAISFQLHPPARARNKDVDPAAAR